MRNHKLIGMKLAKERDYLVIESRSFFCDMFTMISFLKDDNYPREVISLLDGVKDELLNHKLQNMNQALETARKLCWKYHDSVYENKIATILMLLQVLSEFSKLESKEPSEYDLQLRNKK